MHSTRVVAAAALIMSFSIFAAPAGTQPFRESSPPPKPPLVEQWLLKGELAKAEEIVTKALAKDKSDDNLRFQLGTVQFLRGVERLMQSLYKYGLRDYSGVLPFLRVPMGQHPNPEEISYEDLRRIIQTWDDDLMKVEATLAPIRSSDVKLPLHPGLIRLDLDGDGNAGGEETLWRVFETYAGMGLSQKDAQEFLICFDLADVAWLRGYCHLLAAMSDIALAHDFHDLFERTGNIFFWRIKTPHECVRSPARLVPFFGGDKSPDISDLIAFIHLINFPVIEPERMKSALKHLEMMVKLSRESWDLVSKETDDDHEWLPNPVNGQHSALAGLTMSKEQLTAWRKFLDQLDGVLAGKKALAALAPARRPRHQPPPRLHRAAPVRSGSLGPGHGLHALRRERPRSRPGSLATTRPRLPGRVHQLRAVVQLSEGRIALDRNLARASGFYPVIHGERDARQKIRESRSDVLKIWA